jgi:hypothetical protein
MEVRKGDTCPFCGSTDIRKSTYNGVAFVVSFLILGAPIPFFPKKKHCFNCTRDFKSSNKMNDSIPK